MFYKTYYNSPIGEMMMVSDGVNLLGLWFVGQKYFLADIKEDMIGNNDISIFIKTKSWLDRYFKGEKPQISELSFKVEGSDFRKRVWQILCEIPYGKIRTYGDIAEIIAKEKGKTKISAQAVGGAIGHNPVSIIIPCHRVIAANGNLTGYAGGIERKKWLLNFEGVNFD